MRGPPQVVGIEEGDVVARCNAEPGVSRSAHSKVGLPDVPDRGPIRIQTVWRIVGGSVVDDDDFPVWMSLPEDAVQRLRDVRTRVVGGDDDGDKRRCHVGERRDLP